jgi:putative DNA primase/helicase
MNNNTNFNEYGDPAPVDENIVEAQPTPSADDMPVNDVTGWITLPPVTMSADAANDAPAAETLADAIQRLAAMGDVEYEQVRTKEAKTLKVRVSVLDAQVENERARMGNTSAMDEEEAECEVLGIHDDVTETQVPKAKAGLTSMVQPNGIAPNYSVTEKGVFWRDPASADKPKSGALFICSKLIVPMLVRDPASENWGRVLEFADADGVVHKSIMPMTMVVGDGVELRKDLAQQGLEIAPSQQARHHLIAYITGCKPMARGRVVQKTGWYQSVFVLPDRTLGAYNEQVLYQSEQTPRHYAQLGTLSQWQQHVARLCAGNSRLVLSLCAGFAGPLLELVGLDSGGIHFVGPSSIGKTTVLGVGASVFGGPSYTHTWRATGNGLEGLATVHNDTLLVLDEMGELDPKEAGTIAYMIGNGTGKARSDRQGDTRPRKTWRLLFLSSGEVGLAQHMTEGGKTARAGQEVRLIDLPADAGAGYGIFEELHGFESGGQLSNALKDATRHYYGTAALAYIEALTIDLAVLPEKIKDAMNGFIAEYLPEGAGGQAARVCARFAIMAVAGELATEYGVTGWEPGEAIHAAAVCFKAWLDQRGGAGNSERTMILAAVHAYLETHGDSRFIDLDCINERPVSHRAGFRKSVNGQDEYYVLQEVYKSEVCAGFNQRTVTKVLIDEGWLEQDKEGKSSQKKSLPGMGETRVYKITSKIWEYRHVD